MSCEHQEADRCTLYGIKAYWCALCQSPTWGEGYRRLWQEGRGPGHRPTGPITLPKRRSPWGPGDCLHQVLTEKFGQTITAGCNCGEWIARMNKWGPVGCRQHAAEIVDHLLYEAKRRDIRRLGIPAGTIPGARLYLGRLLERAIRRSEADIAKWAARPRVVLYSHALNCGGAERWVVDLARHIDPELLDVSVVVGEGCESCAVDVPLQAKAAAAVPVIVNPAAGRRAIDQSAATVFWSRRPVGSPGAWVFCGHGCGPWLRSFVGTITHDPAVRLVAVSKRVAEELAMPSSAVVIYNGSDPARLVPRAGRRATRERLRVLPDELLVGYIGRIAQAKRPGAVAEAADALCRRGVPAVAVCALGTQGPEHGRLVPPGVPTPILYPRTEDLGDLFAALDCFVLASESEGFSLAMIEAWLTGVPVVSTPVGAVPELEERHGRLVVRVPVGADAETLADAVLEAVADRGMVERAKALAEREFTTEAMGRRWTEYLQGVVR